MPAPSRQNDNHPSQGVKSERYTTDELRFLLKEVKRCPNIVESPSNSTETKYRKAVFWHYVASRLKKALPNKQPKTPLQLRNWWKRTKSRAKQRYLVENKTGLRSPELPRYSREQLKAKGYLENIYNDVCEFRLKTASAYSPREEESEFTHFLQGGPEINVIEFHGGASDQQLASVHSEVSCCENVNDEIESAQSDDDMLSDMDKNECMVKVDEEGMQHANRLHDPDESNQPYQSDRNVTDLPTANTWTPQSLFLTNFLNAFHILNQCNNGVYTFNLLEQLDMARKPLNSEESEVAQHSTAEDSEKLEAHCSFSMRENSMKRKLIKIEEAILKLKREKLEIQTRLLEMTNEDN